MTKDGYEKTLMTTKTKIFFALVAKMERWQEGLLRL
jgi:hypothetical protein